LRKKAESVIITALKPSSQKEAWSLRRTVGMIQPLKGTVSLITGRSGFYAYFRHYVGDLEAVIVIRFQPHIDPDPLVEIPDKEPSMWTISDRDAAMAQVCGFYKSIL
jgi:hypothetical protein